MQHVQHVQHVCARTRPRRSRRSTARRPHTRPGCARTPRPPRRHESRRERRGKPKAGHSLLVGSEMDFDDRLILSAGELWILKDHADDIEAVVIASNSGHFKPDFSALAPARAGLEAIGIPKERIVMFGGPNNIHAVFREVGELHGIENLDARLPPDPIDLLEKWNS